MYKGKKIIAIIPARGGSKGIPQKNITKINDKPLIAFTIDAAMESQFIDRVFVTTDSDEIKNVVQDLNVDVPFLRPDYLATDTSKTIDSILYTLDELGKMNDLYDYVITLQPTQPLRKTKHIDDSIRLIIDNDWQSLASITELDVNPVLIRKFKDNNLLINLVNTKSNVRRQDFVKHYKINGSIYINKIDNLLNKNTSLNDNKHGYLMDAEYDLDIDTPKDLEKFKILINQKTSTIL